MHTFSLLPWLLSIGGFLALLLIIIPSIRVIRENEGGVVIQRLRFVNVVKVTITKETN